MRTKWTLLGIAVLIAGCGGSQPRTRIVNVPGYTSAEQAGLQTQGAIIQSQVPSGTRLQARLNNTITTGKQARGEAFSATVVTPLHNSSGQVILPAGALIHGHVRDARYGSRWSLGLARAKIALAVDSVEMRDSFVPISADVVSADVRTARGFPAILRREHAVMPAGSAIAIELNQPVSTARLAAAFPPRPAMGGGPGACPNQQRMSHARSSTSGAQTTHAHVTTRSASCP
jgi:hypothetical protein